VVFQRAENATPPCGKVIVYLDLPSSGASLRWERLIKQHKNISFSFYLRADSIAHISRYVQDQGLADANIYIDNFIILKYHAPLGDGTI
jgi:hypothetical protein